MDGLEKELEAFKTYLLQERAKKTQLQSLVSAKQAEIASYEEGMKSLQLKKLVLQKAAEEAREQSKQMLEKMGTSALQFILGENHSLQIDLESQAKGWVANFLVNQVYEGKTIKTDPAEEEGGGIADIVSLATQIAMLELTGEANHAPMFMDEPSKFVSASHSEQVAEFLAQMSANFGRQVFMVTHDEYLANIGGTAYQMQKDMYGKTVATRLMGESEETEEEAFV